MEKDIEILDYELSWLSGLIEGDGCFYVSLDSRNLFEIRLQMVDVDVVKRAADLLQSSLVRYHSKINQDTVAFSIRGSKAIALMNLLFPYMGIRRKNKIKECLNIYQNCQKYSKINKKQYILKETGDSVDHIYWLAGILEAEGSFFPGPPSRPNSPIISIQMTDHDVMQKVAYLFGNKLQSYQPKGLNKSGSPHKLVYMCALKGKKAIELMKKLRAHMGARRQQQIDNSLASYDPLVRKRFHEGTRKLTDDDVELAMVLKKSGLSNRAIARSFGVNKDTISSGFKRLVER